MRSSRRATTPTAGLPSSSTAPRGTCRTGSAVALYRYERDGWTVEDVDAEMRRQSYRDGYLAGYALPDGRRTSRRATCSTRRSSTTRNTPRLRLPPKPQREIIPDVAGLPGMMEATHVR